MYLEILFDLETNSFTHAHLEQRYYTIGDEFAFRSTKACEFKVVQTTEDYTVFSFKIEMEAVEGENLSIDSHWGKKIVVAGLAKASLQTE